MTRIDRLRARLDEPLLVTAPANIVYLAGFESSNAALLVARDGPARLFSDFRYAESGRAVEGVEFTMVARNLFAGLTEELSGRVACEADAIRYSAYETLAGAGLDLVPRRGMVEELRAAKDEEELACIRRAAKITDRMFERLADERNIVGETERNIAWRIAALFHDEGAEDLAFQPVVAAGANGANPHAHPGDDEIPSGTTVVIDVGCKVGGYLSDCTRTFCTGPVPERLKEAYRVCLEAQLAGLEAVRAGVTGQDADAVARDVIEAAGFGGQFGHGLGHGVGLEVHEAPTLRPESESVLEPGNVVTVEPGIYLPGEGGIRIEDLVIVTDGEPEVLYSFTKDLLDVS
jgi:Xaa-Pro aminopeptidase